MKAMSKSELADRAGVSLSTLTRWCKPYKDDLNAMGLQPNAKVLPPHIVKYHTEKFCIDI
jgi:transposase